MIQSGDHPGSRGPSESTALAGESGINKLSSIPSKFSKPVLQNHIKAELNMTSVSNILKGSDVRLRGGRK